MYESNRRNYQDIKNITTKILQQLKGKKSNSKIEFDEEKIKKILSRQARKRDYVITMTMMILMLLTMKTMVNLTAPTMMTVSLVSVVKVLMKKLQPPKKEVKQKR